MSERDIKPDQKIRQALDNIVPDEVTKDRMYLEILRKASLSEAKPVKKPWYLRWQTSAGVCSAACICAVIAIAALHHQIPAEIEGELPVVTQPAVTTVSEAEIVPLKTTAASQVTTQLHASVTETAAVTTEQTAVCGLTAEQTDTAVQTAVKTSVQTAAANLQKPVVTTAATGTAKKPEQTTAATKATNPAQQEEITTIAATVPQQTTQAVTTTTTPNVHIYQNIRLYPDLIYQDISYKTDYVSISGQDLTYIGPGLTYGPDVENTHTVLIYSMEGTDTAQQLAVQYVGETTYYLFYAVD